MVVQKIVQGMGFVTLGVRLPHVFACLDGLEWHAKLSIFSVRSNSTIVRPMVFALLLAGILWRLFGPVNANWDSVGPNVIKHVPSAPTTVLAMEIVSARSVAVMLGSVARTAQL